MRFGRTHNVILFHVIVNLIVICVVFAVVAALLLLSLVLLFLLCCYCCQFSVLLFSTFLLLSRFYFLLLLLLQRETTLEFQVLVRLRPREFLEGDVLIAVSIFPHEYRSDGANVIRFIGCELLSSFHHFVLQVLR